MRPSPLGEDSGSVRVHCMRSFVGLWEVVTLSRDPPLKAN